MLNENRTKMTCLIAIAPRANSLQLRHSLPSSRRRNDRSPFPIQLHKRLFDLFLTSVDQMISSPPPPDERNRPSGENDSELTSSECFWGRIRYLFASSSSSGFQMTTDLSSNPLKEKEKRNEMETRFNRFQLVENHRWNEIRWFLPTLCFCSIPLPRWIVP